MTGELIRREARAAAIEEAARWHDDGAINADYAAKVLHRRLAERHRDHARWHRYAAEQLRALAAKPGSQLEWRHRKRGSTYVERDRGELQLATDHVLQEGDRLVSYRGEDGRVWFRYEPEFEDGRFERIAAKPGSET